MYPSSIQIQSPDDEEEDQPEELQDDDNSISKDSAIKQSGKETLHSYYEQRFGQTQDFRVKSGNTHYEKWPVFVCSGAVSSASNPMKISYERLMQEGFDSASARMEAKKRKAEAIEVHGGAGRLVRSSGRKDRHSKVRTARGPRDRRVRLSPATAIQFYDVQDRLGYDRPSKAIDWLIKESKAAIDALDEQPNINFSASNASENHSPPISNHGGFLISECGVIEKHERLNDENLVSDFSFCVDGAVPSSSTEFQAYLDQYFYTSINGNEASEDVIIYPSDQQGFCSALLASSETNWEMARLQKTLTWNCGNGNSGNTGGSVGGTGGVQYSSVNSPPLLSPARPISGHNHMFSQREPLQSSFINYSPIITDVPGFSFCNELSNITASSTLKKMKQRRS